MEIMSMGNLDKIWHGVEVCHNCGSTVRIKRGEIGARIEAAEGCESDDGLRVRTVYWFTCIACGEQNYISAERAVRK